MQISVIGTNFRTADVARREPLALDGEGVLRVLAAIREGDLVPEAAVLSTCNRTEVIYAAAEASAEPRLLEALGAVCGAAVDASMFYRHDGLAAVTHVFRVAAALDSQVVGEHEILGQLKEAYRLAVEAGTAGFLLHKLMHRAFRVGKRVQSETHLGEGRAGLPQQAAAVARARCGELAERTVMLIGAGKAGRLAATALVRDGARRLILVNRSAEPAAALAKTLSTQQPGVEVRTIGLEEVGEYIAEADTVISSTGAGQAVLTHDGVGAALAGHKRAVVMIDLAVPRDIDPRLGELVNVELVNIDALKGRAEVALGKRRRHVPAAEGIVRDEAAAFSRWLDSLQVAPVIKGLQDQLAALQRREIDRLCCKHPELDRRVLERFAHGLTRKALHGPITFLKRLAAEGKAGADLASLDLLRRMFGLQDDESTKG